MEIKRKKAKIVSVRDYSVTTELNKKNSCYYCDTKFKIV